MHTFTATGPTWWHAVTTAITAANQHPGTVTRVLVELHGDTYRATITTRPCPKGTP